jgi:hypothetical protein
MIMVDFTWRFDHVLLKFSFLPTTWQFAIFSLHSLQRLKPGTLLVCIEMEIAAYPRLRPTHLEDRDVAWFAGFVVGVFGFFIAFTSKTQAWDFIGLH